LYRKILNWVTTSLSAETNFRSQQFSGKKALSREGLLEVLNKRYGSQKKCFPTSQAVTLPKSLVKFNVIHFNFLEQMFSLLSDTTLIKAENLLFHNDNPFPPPPNQNPKELQDINDGSVYRKAYQKFVHVPNRDIICRLILFIDETHLSVQGHLTLEPVTMTLAILNKEARRYPHAWRTLGFINRISNVDSAKNKTATSDKAGDYHFVLSTILGISLPGASFRWNHVESQLQGPNLPCLLKSSYLGCYL
jgi:hypothetical protein